MQSNRKRILVAMSGGVDSSVVAMLLHHQEYQVVGITMKTWDYVSSHSSKKETGCCSLDSINDARNVSINLGFSHYVLDLREEFGNKIIHNFISEYTKGNTPNPCVLCNTFVKWEALLKRSLIMDCEYIATGHYAKIREEEGRFILSKSADPKKDQTYVLWGLSQNVLSKTKFPLENLQKQQVRKIASQHNFDMLSKKPESYEICFIPDNDYRTFLKNATPNYEENFGKGKFINDKGEELGTNEGVPMFTVGQRKKLGIATGKRMFVTKIDPKKNTVTLGTREELARKKVWVKDYNLIKYPFLTKPLKVKAKVRYNTPEQNATLFPKDDRLIVKFDDFVYGVASGQSCVFYENDDVVGGGIIESSK